MASLSAQTLPPNAWGWANATSSVFSSSLFCTSPGPNACTSPGTGPYLSSSVPLNPMPKSGRQPWTVEAPPFGDNFLVTSGNSGVNAHYASCALRAPGTAWGSCVGKWRGAGAVMVDSATLTPILLSSLALVGSSGLPATPIVKVSSPVLVAAVTGCPSESSDVACTKCYG